MALRETQCDQLMEAEEAIIPSQSPVELTQPFVVEPDNETLAPKTSLPSLRKTRSESRMAGYVRPSIMELPLSATILSLRRASPDPPSPRTVLLRHLPPRDLLSRGRPSLLIAAVDS